jgi:hypothetical protein
MFVEAKELSDVTFYSVPESRRANLFFHHNAQSVKCVLILLDKKDKVPGGIPPS